MRNLITTTLLTFGLTALAALPVAGDEAADAALAAESEAYCSSTARADQTTLPQDIVAKVQEACTLLEQEGAAGYAKFKGKDSAFIYQGTYVWVHSLADAEMLMHPIKYKMVGNKLISLKDPQGKRFFVVMNNLVKEKGEGWVEYFWPVPGSSEITRKVSFIKACKMADGTEVVVGSGIYNGNEQELAKLEIH